MHLWSHYKLNMFLGFYTFWMIQIVTQKGQVFKGGLCTTINYLKHVSEVTLILIIYM